MAPSSEHPLSTYWCGVACQALETLGPGSPGETGVRDIAPALPLEIYSQLSDRNETSKGTLAERIASCAGTWKEDIQGVAREKEGALGGGGGKSGTRPPALSARLLGASPTSQQQKETRGGAVDRVDWRASPTQWT